jgi:hypothetical protein
LQGAISVETYLVFGAAGLGLLMYSIGGVCGIWLITIILHLSASPARGFRAVFIGFGLGLLLALPLVFLMPSGRREAGRPLPQKIIGE